MSYVCYHIVSYHTIITYYVTSVASVTLLTLSSLGRDALPPNISTRAVRHNCATGRCSVLPPPPLRMRQCLRSPSVPDQSSNYTPFPNVLALDARALTSTTIIIIVIIIIITITNYCSYYPLRSARKSPM